MRLIRPALMYAACLVLAGVVLTGNASANFILDAKVELNGPGISSEKEQDDIVRDPAGEASVALSDSTVNSSIRGSAVASITRHRNFSRVALSNEFDGGRALAETITRDVFNVVGAGTLTFGYRITGGIGFGGRRDTAATSFFRDVLRDDLGFSLLVELERTRRDRGRLTEFFGLERDDFTGPGTIIETLSSPVDRVVELTVEVTTGEWDYEMRSDTNVNVDNFIGTGIASFGSTAELIRVAASEGVTFEAESGFDYLSLTGGTPGGGTPGDDRPVAVPAPAPLLLLALGLMAIGVGRSRA